MGTVVSGCTRCATYIHDRCLDREWDAVDGPFYQMAAAPAPVRIKSIFTAIIDRNKSEARRIVTEQPESRSKVNSGSETAVHMACSLGYQEMFTVLLECGCPVDVRTSLGTPLHSVNKAVRAGYINSDVAVEMIRTLVNAGCDINATDRSQCTPLRCAAHSGDHLIVKELLRLGANVNLGDVNLFPPLYVAVIGGQLECVRVILADAHEVHVNYRDGSGRTALQAALIFINNSFRHGGLGDGSSDILLRNRLVAEVEMLLAAGADPNLIDDFGRQPLVMAFVSVELDCLTRMACKSKGDVTYYVTESTCELLEGSRGTGTSAHGNGEGDDRLMDVFFRQCEAFIENGPDGIPESCYAALVRLLLLYGARFVRPWQRTYTEAPAWLRELYHLGMTGGCCLPPPPHPLAHLTRMAIRLHLASLDRIQDIARVPLPHGILDYCF